MLNILPLVEMCSDNKQVGKRLKMISSQIKKVVPLVATQPAGSCVDRR